MSEPKSLRAYKVECDDADHGAVIKFASRGKDVSRYANGDMCDCEFINRRVVRAKEFDKYSPGPITIQQFLSEGWYWECGGCGSLVHADEPYAIVDSYIFCKEACLLRHHDDYERRHPGDEWHKSIRDFRDAMRGYVEAKRYAETTGVEG